MRAFIDRATYLSGLNNDDMMSERQCVFFIGANYALVFGVGNITFYVFCWFALRFLENWAKYAVAECRRTKLRS